MTHSLRTIVLEAVSYLLIWRASFSFLLTSWKYLLVYPIISKWMCLLIRIFQENRIKSVCVVGGYGKIFIMDHEVRYWEDKRFTCKLGKQRDSQANSKSEDDGSDNLRPSPSLKTQDSETPKPLAEELNLGRNLICLHLFQLCSCPQGTDWCPPALGRSLFTHSKDHLLLSTVLVPLVKLTHELPITIGKQSSLLILKNMNKCDHNLWCLFSILWY